MQSSLTSIRRLSNPPEDTYLTFEVPTAVTMKISSVVVYSMITTVSETILRKWQDGKVVPVLN
jgi:hypothetical protein